MTYKEVLSRVDHTLLRPEATWEQIGALCDDAVRFQTASVCIPPCYVQQAVEYLEGRIPVCTVIGFPNGYNETDVKMYEAAGAVGAGAGEIDMVANIGWIKAGEDGRILEEINRIKAVCGERILKVIIETCLLTEEEKIRMCRIVSESRADFIKTSTGFGTAGATFEDVALLKAHMAPEKQIKAAGGISGFADAVKFLSLGADRLGTSRLVEQVKKEADLDGQI